MAQSNYFLRNCRIIISLSLILISFSSLSSQVKTEWIKTFNSAPNLVDYGRKIKLDSDGNVFVCGHSFVNEDQEGVTTILKYRPDGNQVWAKFTEEGVNMEDFQIDASGNLFVSGDKWNGSNFDILLIKYDNEGEEIWRKFFDGGGWDRSFSIVIDRAGNIYQAGITWFQPEYYNIVTIKYNSSGENVWTKTFTSKGQFSDYGKKIILDNSENVYVAGFAGDDIAVIKYSADGNELWSDLRSMNLQYDEFFSPHILVDAHDNLIVCGTSYNPITRSDIVVSKYDSAGNRQWEKLWNNSGNDSDVVSGDAIGDEALAVDKAGNIYVTGTTIDPDIIFSDNVVTLKYNSGGDLAWSHIYDGPASDWDRPYSIKVSDAGNVYVSGETVVTANSLVPLDYLTMKLNQNGQLQWVQNYNGVGDFYDKAAAMTIDDKENVLVTGISKQDGELFGGNSDIVTIKYAPSTTGIISNNIVSDYKLFQNYPNPFNPETQIKYSIPTSSFVSLKVFDITGREVTTLVNQIENPGEYSVNFNASGLTSGTYFYKLETKDFKVSKRMMLVK